MTPAQLEKLRLIFCQTLNLSSDAKPEQLHRCSVQSWDSLAQVSLVSAIETEFNLLLEPEEFALIVSYDAAVKLLGTKSIAS